MFKYESLPPDIMDRLPRVVELLEQESAVDFAYLFGSLVEGVVAPNADVDIAVYILPSTSTDPEFKFDLFCRLTDILHTSELDLVILNDAPLSLSGRILQQRRVLVDKDPPRRHCFESCTMRKFFDFSVKMCV